MLLYVARISGAQFASLRGSDVLANFLNPVDALLLDSDDPRHTSTYGDGDSRSSGDGSSKSVTIPPVYGSLRWI
ncbi:hypothetical protein CPLU01_03698 [Colletotrichum plurivorum]|uniref:Uncharacterized protein n=1 Tax=Colletotrichum plurivorum TaxID=2175906 RepID=A0A8H6KRL3_9PEZI|nr:hypothetical protein CPLU01_03698 [Colletotrichum plurivorum]